MGEPSTAKFDLLQWMPGPVQVAFRQALRPRRYAAGQIIYLQGDPGLEMYRIASGYVRLSVTRGDGRELIVFLFDPGDCFGGSSLVDGECRPQTAEALTDVELECLDIQAYRRLRQDHRAFDEALMRMLARQMRFASARFADVSLSGLRARVAARILERAQAAEAVTGADMRLKTRLSQAELARMVGASRQTVNRTLRTLQAEGLITTEYGNIVVQDLAGLARCSEDL